MSIPLRLEKAMEKNSSDITCLFEPRSIAVIGASHDTDKIGYKILSNIVSGGYRGAVYPVNPQGGEILGHRAYKTIEEVPGDVDVVSIVIPAKLVLDSVTRCAARGVKVAQIITSGFSEAGNAEEEKRIVAVARERGMRILGPNIFGLYSSGVSLNSTFSATGVRPGHVAILTQSGALGIALIGKTAVENIGLSAIVSIGNKCDIDEADLLEYLIAHDGTRVVLMYIEGVKNGERLIESLMRTTDVKPVVVIKSGRSKRGAMAAASHTGSLAGSDDIFDAIMKQCGVIRADSIEEAFNWSKFLAFSPRPKGNKSVIITNGGGVGVMATDACERYGIDLYDDQAELKKAFETVVPSFGSTKNPVDLTGGANAKDYDLALSVPASSPGMDATIALYCETATFDSAGLVPMIRETYRKNVEAGKPVCYAIVGGSDVEAAINSLRQENVPVYGDVYEAVSCLGMLYRFDRSREEKGATTDEAQIDVAAIDRIIDGALSDNRKFLLANESSAVMKAAGVSIPQAKVVRTIGQVVQVAEEIGYPLVLKVVSKDILHKSDAGGVALDIDNREEALDAYEAIMQNCRAYKPDAHIEGIEICEMVSKGTEIIVGARRDASFGPIVMCGFGGIYVEVMKDVAFRGFPFNRAEAMKMLKELRSFPLLLGVRGEARRDIEGLIEAMIKVATIIRKCPRVTDIEINPVVVYEQGRGHKAVDSRILIGAAQQAP
ncbi:MAG: acetate--CoA ligase family protein [Spirochaetes bacterium]|nr:acetate--CoA ligase family protein [Spirochaetota bacterium]